MNPERLTFETKIVHKAVQIIDGRVFTLGMGPASVVELPVGQVIDGGEDGIWAARIPSEAGNVIIQAKRRKVKSVPENMRVIRVKCLNGKRQGPNRYICEKIYIDPKDVEQFMDYES